MFYLVGSRFFGNNRPDSDWDFIGEDTPETRAYLESQGLKRIPSPYVRYWGKSRDICLVKNVARQVRARDILAQVPGVQFMSKAERHSKLKEILDAN